MDNEIKFTSNLKKVNDKIELEIYQALEEASGELEKQVIQNTREDTGKTKGSWKHYVSISEHAAYVGSNYENAIWEEFGTGHYALNGDGRKDSWSYQDNFGVWHTTDGKEPNRPLQRAKDNTLDKIKSLAQKLFGEL